MSRLELVAAGVTRREIDRRLEDGRLQRLHRGVYAVGHRALRVEGIWWAAVLAGGPGAMLSHRALARLSGLPEFPHDRIEIRVIGERARRLTTVHAHRGPLTRADTTVWRGLPTTAPAMLALDLAEVLDDGQLDRALDELVPSGSTTRTRSTRCSPGHTAGAGSSPCSTRGGGCTPTPGARGPSSSASR